MLILLLEREQNGWSESNRKKEAITETQIGKETKKTSSKGWEEKTKKRVLQSLRTYCHRSVCVRLSSIRPANAGLRINKPDALCHRYLPSFLSTPSAAIANFSLVPLPEEKERQTVELRCHYISMKTNYFLEWGKWKSWPDLHYTAFKVGGWIVFPSSLISFRADESQ